MHKTMKCLMFSMLIPFVATSAHAAGQWSTSADIRERYQNFNNFNFNSSVNNNSWEFDSRLYIKTKAEFANGISLYFQPQAVLIQEHTVARGTQTLSQSDLLQGFLQVDQGDFALRLGRQQMAYGDQRLIGYLGWKDVARTFDGVRLMYKSGDEKVDIFAVHPSDITAMTPTPASPHGQSLVTSGNSRLVGLYNTYAFSPATGIDAYLINWQQNQDVVAGKGRNINTFGTRLFAHWNGFDATGEAVLQRGDWANGIRQKASAYAIKAGYTFGFWKTRLGIEYDYSPGDDKSDPTTHKDFVFPFHTNHAHYGEMDFFSWANMKDVDLSLKTSPIAGLKLMGNVHFLSLDKATGDWLNVVGTGAVFAGSPGYTQTKAGTEIDLKAAYNVAAVHGLKLVGLYGVFRPGSAVAERNAGKADNATFAYILANYMF